MTATVSVNVSALPDNDVWFQNAAAWNSYWSNVTANVTLDEIDNQVYTPSTYNPSGDLYPEAFQIGGEVKILVTEAMFNSLLTRLNTLNSSYELLRTELRNAGLLKNAQ